MNKKLLMAAVGAALVAGPMVAVHAAGATLYGHMHMSLDRQDNDSGNEDGSMSSNASRIGVKGDEDLGGGLKAIYQLEAGVAAIDEGAGGLGGTLRNSFVGFAGSWGAVKLGRHDTPYKDLSRKLDNFNEQIGDTRNIIGNATYDKRVSNMIRYESPMFGGANVVVQNTSNDGAENVAASNKDSSLGLNWTSGPLFLGAAWNEVGNATTNDTTGKRLAGSYTFNDIVLGLLWESLSDIGGTSGHDRDTMGLFAALKMGNNLFKLSYFDADKYDDVANTAGKLWAAGVDHSFSKTTKIYFNYASVDNDSVATTNLASKYAGHGETEAPSITAGKSPTAFSLGTIIKF